jgi:hypothetical protein
MVIDSCKFYLKKNGTPTNIKAKLYSHSGVWGSSGYPGTLLATSDTVDASAIATGYGLITFTFSGANRVALTNGAHYCILITCAQDTSNYLNYGYDGSSPAAGGNLIQGDGSTWTSYDWADAIFYVYGDTAPLTGEVRVTQVSLEVLRSIGEAAPASAAMPVVMCIT